MKTFLTAIYSLALLFAFGNANAWSQVQWAGGPSGLHNSVYAENVVPATYCDDCGDTTGGCACDSSGHSGLLDGLHAIGASGGWGSVEYLLWWGKERYVPALVTTSPSDTPPNLAGRLGQPTTFILFGNEMIGDDPASGVRFSWGKWLDEHQTIGIGSRFSYLQNEDDFFQSSSGVPILARPYNNVDPAVLAEDAVLVAYPSVLGIGGISGNIDVSAENEFRGYDLFLRKLLLTGYCNRWDVVGGYHYSRLKDSVDIRHSLVNRDPFGAVPVGAEVFTNDYFEVRNEFQGGFVGIMFEGEDGRLSWSMLSKIAFGNMNQRARINGVTTTTVPGPPDVTNTENYGLLTLPSNIGEFDEDEFAMVPELTVSVGYNVTNNLQVTVGYSLIYWTEVALAGDMIDTTINPTQIGGPLVGAARPLASLTSDGFWYTGLNVGGTLRF